MTDFGTAALMQHWKQRRQQQFAAAVASASGANQTIAMSEAVRVVDVAQAERPGTGSFHVCNIGQTPRPRIATMPHVRRDRVSSQAIPKRKFPLDDLVLLAWRQSCPNRCADPRSRDVQETKKNARNLKISGVR
jgi:hypothetical protein